METTNSDLINAVAYFTTKKLIAKCAAWVYRLDQGKEGRNKC